MADVVIRYRTTRRAAWQGALWPSGGGVGLFAGAAAPFAAVGQVGAHRRARGVGVLRCDGVEDALVLAVDALQVGAARAAAASRRRSSRARGMIIVPSDAHQFGEVRVLRRARDLEVELEVGADGVAALLDRRGERVERGAHLAQVAGRAPLRGQARRPRSRRRCAVRAPRSRRAGSPPAPARCETARASPKPTTKVPMPWRVCTRPEACSLDSASRTTVRLTPNSAMISASVGSLSPGASRPSRMRSPSDVDQFERQRARPAACGGIAGSGHHRSPRKP